MKRRIALLLLTAPALARAQAAGPFRLEAGVPVHGFRPAGWREGGPVALVLHGAGRDADRYRDAWAPQAEAHGLLVACPEFSRAAFPGEAGYNLNPAVFGHLDAVADALGAPRFALYGHSAGAQVAHRLLLRTGAPRVTRLVAANAGWYSFPDPATPFPHGLGGVATELPAAWAKPATILLGEADTDPHHPALRRDAETDRQGVTRFERGQRFFAACQAAAGEALRWRLATVPGVGHSNAGMAPAAARFLLDPA